MRFWTVPEPKFLTYFINFYLNNDMIVKGKNNSEYSVDNK